MDMDQSAVFLAGSILTMLGFIIVIAGIVAINNIIHKYWKPVRLFTADSWQFNPPPYYEELKENKNAKENQTSSEVKGS